MKLLDCFAKSRAALTSPVKKIKFSDNFAGFMINNFEGVESSIDDKVLHRFSLLEYYAALVIPFHIFVLLQPEHLFFLYRMVHNYFPILPNTPNVWLAEIDGTNPSVSFYQRYGPVSRKAK